MEEFLISQIMGFAIGILSSWIFWYLLILAKPRIKIAPVATYSPSEKVLRIKVMNRGRRQAVDIQAQIVLRELRPVAGESLKQTVVHRPKLRNDMVFAMGPIQHLKKHWTLLTGYIFLVEDGEETYRLLQTPTEFDKRIVFILSATDALSGTKVVQMATYQVQDIAIGRFGDGFDVVHKIVQNDLPIEDNSIVQ